LKLRTKALISSFNSFSIGPAEYAKYLVLVVFAGTCLKKTLDDVRLTKHRGMEERCEVILPQEIKGEPKCESASLNISMTLCLFLISNVYSKLTLSIISLSTPALIRTSTLVISPRCTALMSGVEPDYVHEMEF
jgi:hypothetical protein